MENTTKPIKSMDAEEAKAYINQHKEGAFNLIDVRQPGEYETQRIPGAKLISLPELNERLNEIEPAKPTIVYCASGRRSLAASQLMVGQGFGDVYNLVGGIKSWQGHGATGPPDFGLTSLTGDESPEEMLILAYGLEHGLKMFYQAQADKNDDEELNRLLSNLADIEEAHKNKVFSMYLNLTKSDIGQDAFESKTVSDMMEGGFTPESFYEQNQDLLQTVEGVLDLAMMLETQSLDLYLRFSQKIMDKQSQKVLNEIADDEKTHLTALGRLMDAKVGY